MEQLGFHWNDFHEILYMSIFRKSVKKTHVSLKSDKNYGFLRMGNISDKICKENQNTISGSINSPPPENPAVYEIMWKNAVESGRPQITIRQMRILC